MGRAEPADHPARLFDHANTLLARGQPDAAAETFRRCLTLVPDHSGTLYNLGNALRLANRPVEAIDAFVHCLRILPDFGPAFVNLAETLHQLGLLDQARAMAAIGLQHLPEEPEAAICLASILHDSADYEAAAALYAQALTCAPAHAGALSSLGNTLSTLGRIPDALAAHDQAIAAAPNNPGFHLNRAMALLAAGDFAAGWDDHEWRWQCAQAKPRGFGSPWQGEDIQGQTILLHAEQGLGDTLQFARYAPMVAARGARVLLEVQPSLVRLLHTLPGVAEVLPRGAPLPPFDTHCPLLSLPRAFATSLETIPAAIPYLHAKPARNLPGSGLRVGLVWSGSAHKDDAGAHMMDQRRSIPLAAFAPLADLPNIHLISLQKHDPEHVWTPPPGLTLIDRMEGVTDFVDTAALVAALDLVIAVDTSVAHLAGALGRPVWLLSRYDGCWRWLHDRADSPWYPTMRIYRQDRPLDWAPVIARVRQDLAALTLSMIALGGTPAARESCDQTIKHDRAGRNASNA